MDYEDYEIDDSKSAKFNAGVLQTQRINKVLDLLNYAKVNPKAYNEEYSEFNYYLWFRSANNLYDEIDGFVNKDERARCLKIRYKIELLLDKFPIYIDKKVSPNQIKKIPDEVRWAKIRKAIEIYEREVKQLGIKYQILSAFKEPPGRI